MRFEEEKKISRKNEFLLWHFRCQVPQGKTFVTESGQLARTLRKTSLDSNSSWSCDISKLFGLAELRFPHRGGDGNDTTSGGWEGSPRPEHEARSHRVCSRRQRLLPMGTATPQGTARPLLSSAPSAQALPERPRPSECFPRRLVHALSGRRTGGTVPGRSYPSGAVSLGGPTGGADQSTHILNVTLQMF